MSGEPPSIIGRLRHGFAWIAAIGAVILAAFLIADFELMKAETRAAYGVIGIVHEVVYHVVFPIVVLLAPLAVATGWLISRSLSPLTEAAERIHQAAGQDRGFRVETGNLPVEALPFADAVNQLLARLDDAARRQEGFAADVAHELKTPLSVVMLELQHLGTVEARRIFNDLAAMNRLIEQLLILAQLDAYAAAPQPFRMLDLRDVALDAIKLTALDAARRGVKLALQHHDPQPVSGRREALAAAIRNLIENAIRVTPDGGEVVVTCGPGPHLRVSDGGQGIDASALAQLCDRFNRGDHASPGGAGLGLSIVARVMEVHRGAIGTDKAASTLVLTFPENSFA
jgi:two-component system, OmpR family, sensor kinase